MLLLMCIPPTHLNRIILICLTVLFFGWSTGVLCDDSYREIHRVWPSLRMPNVIISQPTAEDEAELYNSQNQTMEKLPSMPTREASAKKTVVFPSPICVSLPMAPCIILQVFWRNSSSSVFGAKIPVSRLPSFPRPRDRQLSSSQLYALQSG